MHRGNPEEHPHVLGQEAVQTPHQRHRQDQNASESNRRNGQHSKADQMRQRASFGTAVVESPQATNDQFNSQD
jgi:hypothetical protein